MGGRPVAPGDGSVILVAEDDPTSQRLITRLLQADGYNVVVVERGDDVLWALGLPDAPSLVVLDWLLPGMDGIEVCHRLRERNPDVRPYILMVTDSTDASRRAEGYQAGVNDFLRRPFDQQELRMRVRIGRQAVIGQPRLGTERAGATSAATNASPLEDTCHIHPGCS